MISRNGLPIYGNQLFLKMFDLQSHEDLIQRPVYTFFAPQFHQESKERTQRRREGSPVLLDIETVAQRVDGALFPVTLTTTQVHLSDGLANVGFVTDISDRKRMEDTLRKSEEKFSKSFMLNPASIVIVELGENSQFIDVNEAYCQITGNQRSDVVGRHRDNLNMEVDLHGWDKLLERVSSEGRVRNVEYRFRRKNGAVGTSLLSAESLEMDGKQYAIVSAIDISESKQAKEQLEATLQQLHTLTIHLQTIREEERASIAREIHDELGQALTGLKMDLFWLKGMRAKTQADQFPVLVEDKLASALENIDQTINLVRNISTSLRPSILDTLGLIPALDWLARDFSLRSGIQCTFTTRQKKAVYSKSFVTTLFRICQEALTNVARHAHATRVKVNLGSNKDNIFLTVHDNGLGISMEDIHNANSLGILGMQERAYAFNGHIDYRKPRTGGTKLVAHFPKTPAIQPDKDPSEGPC